MRPKDTAVTVYKFGPKSVFVFSDHAVALKAWAHIRQTAGVPLILFTLDHHTDTHDAFIGYGVRMNGSKWNDDWRKFAKERIARVDIVDPEAIDSAVRDLENDEHICAAIDLNILEAAFVVAFSPYPNGGTSSEESKRVAPPNLITAIINNLNGITIPEEPLPPRPHTYVLPSRRVFYLPNQCFVGCNSQPHTEECRRPHADQAIETVFLDHKLEYCDEMIASLGYRSIFERPYILDIDLDYFQTKAALSPCGPNAFYRLIRGAAAVTIALEPRFVRLVRIDEDLESDFCFDRVKKHCEAALGSCSEIFNL
ncbi:MAG TPA: hypothetical protein VNU49_06795 [Opitutaceae bacterium]|jgi:hypothetical protein|nr:hypothetical protein [Opitutaceae bacterium]